ncbi:ADP-ribosylation factor-like protein 2 [Cladophialophora carrionii]|uniref:ADP-ribosylation factor-like protein 2 n=1 Tax=Cladophialophora carrionii TaxID=86049 RepID=A0A1C1C837_9EURO|nr:ADP-ribosylation factor-like protein 2 [Cladophialophora carrionii]
MLSILRKARLKDKEMRILMLGLDNAGKTTIVKKIMNEDVHTVSPTLGFIIKTIDFQGYAPFRRASSGETNVFMRRYKLNIWDVGGQKTIRSYWRNYFEKTDALIWVVDATDRLRLDDCKAELKGLLLEEVSGHAGRIFAKAESGQRLAGASLLVFLNKTDVAGSMSEQEATQLLDLNSILTHRWVVVPCSAMTGENLEKGLDWVVQDARDRLFLY